MKVFLAAVVIMVLTAVFVLGCGWYVERQCCIMLEGLEKLPVEGDKIREFGDVYIQLEKTWKESRRWMNVILGRKTAEDIATQLAETGIRYIGGDFCGYETAREKLAVYLEKIREGERLGVDSIL